jgi:ATP-dependent DNA ligase
MVPELLTRVMAEHAAVYILNDRYWVQPKRDGERLLICRKGEDILGWNKKGQPTSVARQLCSVLRSVSIETFTLDGEIEASGYHVWDLLQINEDNLTTYEYRDRYSILQHFSSLPLISVVPTWKNASDKERTTFEYLQQGVEGIVFKDSLARYRPGRAGQHFKLKFERTATVRIKALDITRDSAIIEMHDGGQWQEVSGIKVKRGEVNPGDYVEVRYLSATESRRLLQPVFIRLRRDVSDEDCSIGQVEFSGRWSYLRKR